MTDRIQFDEPLSRLALLRPGKNPRVVSGLWFCRDYTPVDTLCVRIGGSRITCACRLLEQKSGAISVLRFNVTLRTQPGLKWMRLCRESEALPSRVITRRLLNMPPRPAEHPPLACASYGKTQAALLATLPVPAHGPLVSVIMPVFNPPLKFLDKAIASVRAQSYPNWELCIADDASTDPRVRKLLDREATRDPRVKVVHRPVNGHISAASNSALALASGEWCALLDQDDELAPQAFAAFVHALAKRPDASLAYSDEDKIGSDEKRLDPYHKPHWMPELLLGQNFVSHLGLYRADRMRAIGGFREGYEGCQDWDLVLRYTRDLPASRILHLPFVLYHWRILPGSTARSVAEKPYVATAARRTVRDALDARSLDARLGPSSNGQFHIELVPRPHPSVTVLGLDDPSDRARLAALTADTTLRFADRPRFETASLASFSEAARAAGTDLVVLMPPDLLPRHPDWLRRLAAALSAPGVGAAGGCLIDASGRVVSGSLGLDQAGAAAPAFARQSESAPGYFGRAHMLHNPRGLDLRGVILRRDSLLAIDLPDHSAPADPVSDGWLLCAALRAAGARLIHDPGVKLDLVPRKTSARRHTATTHRRQAPASIPAA